MIERDGARSPSPPIVVTGMHRSGTSLVASLLLASGVHMGDRLMPGGIGNPLGHFENLDFVEFHERVLRDRGEHDAGWGAVSPIEPTPSLLTEATELMRKCGRETPWGWKDPRTTLMLDLWSAACEDAFFVFLYREPALVVDSLYRRGDQAIIRRPELAIESWISYNSTILRFARTRRARCIIINSEAVAAAPQAFLAAVQERLGITLNVKADSGYRAELLTPRERVASEAIVLRHLLPEVAHVYAALQSAATVTSPDQDNDLNHVTARDARSAFFSSWLSTSTDSVRAPENSASANDALGAAIYDNAALAADLSRAVARLRDVESRRTSAGDSAHRS